MGARRSVVRRVQTKFSSKERFSSNQAFGGVTVKQGTVK